MTHAVYYFLDLKADTQIAEIHDLLNISFFYLPKWYNCLFKFSLGQHDYWDKYIFNFQDKSLRIMQELYGFVTRDAPTCINISVCEKYAEISIIMFFF